MSDSIDIKALRELLTKARTGVWEADTGGYDSYIYASSHFEGAQARIVTVHGSRLFEDWQREAEATARLIAAVVNALPALLDEIERLQRVETDARGTYTLLQETFEKLPHDIKRHLYGGERIEKIVPIMLAEIRHLRNQNAVRGNKE